MFRNNLQSNLLNSFPCKTMGKILWLKIFCGQKESSKITDKKMKKKMPIKIKNSGSLKICCREILWRLICAFHFWSFCPALILDTYHVTGLLCLQCSVPHHDHSRGARGTLKWTRKPHHTHTSGRTAAASENKMWFLSNLLIGRFIFEIFFASDTRALILFFPSFVFVFSYHVSRTVLLSSFHS